MDILLLLIMSVALQILFFVPAFWLQTDKITDLSYTLTFLLLTGLTLLKADTLSQYIAAACITIWALRLGYFLLRRIIRVGKDARFDTIRNKFFSFLFFWIMQGVIVWVVLLGYFSITQTNMFTLVVGVFIWVVGFSLESIADSQKSAFNKSQSKIHSRKWIENGLWNYSRHPNYFGEILIWIGIALIAFPATVSTNWWLPLLSPLTLALLLIFFTGIAPLEKRADEKWGKDPEYQEYKRRTSVLVLWFKKK